MFSRRRLTALAVLAAAACAERPAPPIVEPVLVLLEWGPDRPRAEILLASTGPDPSTLVSDVARIFAPVVKNCGAKMGWNRWRLPVVADRLDVSSSLPTCAREALQGAMLPTSTSSPASYELLIELRVQEPQ